MYIYVLSKYYFAKALFSSIYTRLTFPYQPLNVYKVIRYSSSENESEDVTDIFLKGCIIPYSETEYLEFRVKWLKTKYRFIVSSKQPNYPSFVNFTSAKKLNWIIKASLINPEDDICEDVLARVLKFYGPNHNVFDNNISIDQMFKGDELRETMRLVIMTSGGDVLIFGSREMFDLKKKSM